MKVIRRYIYKSLLRCLPANRVGDNIISFIKFFVAHNRLPNKHLLNDKLFKIKTSDDILNILRQYTSDKEFVKRYIANTVGEHLNVPTISILKTPEEILSFNFKRGNVIKPTHASGLVEFVKNKAVNKKNIIKWLDIDYYMISREANYRYLEPKIIVEDCLFGRTDVDDIKFFCVNGEAKIIQWDFDRMTNHTRVLFDRNWNNLDASLGYPLSSKTINRPIKLDEMTQVAEKLSKPFSLVRVDLYYDEISTKYFVGEITHCHGSAGEKFNSQEAEIKVGKILFS